LVFTFYSAKKLGGDDGGCIETKIFSSSVNRKIKDHF